MSGGASEPSAFSSAPVKLPWSAAAKDASRFAEGLVVVGISAAVGTAVVAGGL